MLFCHRKYAATLGSLIMRNAFVIQFEVNTNVFLKKIYVPKLFLYSNKSATYSKKRVEETMWKQLLKATAKKEDNSIVLNPPQSNSFPKTVKRSKSAKQLNRNVLLREKNLEAVFLRELKDIIDSRQIGDEVADLGVTFSSATILSKNACAISWESQGSTLDHKIQEVLSMNAGLLRHLIINNYIVGQVPKFIFVLNHLAEERHKIDEILATGSLDIGLVDEDDAVLMEQGLQVEENESKGTRDVVSSDPTFEMFGVDCMTLRRKVFESKSKISYGQDES